MTTIFPWQPNATCDRVIRHLVEGRCVALPTESTYEIVASALQPAALAKQASEAIPAIALLDYADLFDWMPRLRGAGARLMRKLGPGPVTLRANGGFAAGLWARLSAAGQQLVAPDGLLALRWPAHPIWTELRQAGLPLLTVPRVGAINAEQVALQVGSDVACIVDAGPTQFAGLPTVVRVEERHCVVERAGVLTQEQIDELSLCRILFVCTGNTCRSPLAESLCAKLLAEHLGDSPTELRRRGFCVQSAGLAAMMGSEASPEGIAVAAELGADLAHHHSRMVTREMLEWADHIFGMTLGHCSMLENLPIGLLTLPRLLSSRHEDIADPIGGALSDYRTCAHQILACLQERLPELLES